MNQIQKQIHQERIQKLNKKPINKDGKYVAYWVQNSQRSIYNHALEYAILEANKLESPLFCFFGLTPYPNANARPYHFMIQGLKELQEQLKKRNIDFYVQLESPDEFAIKVSKNAKLLVVDRGYMRIQKQWRKKVADTVDCEFTQIETDVLVPVESASTKEEFAARTIRPKITNLISYFAVQLNSEPLSIINKKPFFDSIDLTDIDGLIKQLGVDTSVKPVKEFVGGELEANKRLDEFLNKKIKNYSEQRNDPSIDGTSNLSPYLHFGMISPLYIYLETIKRVKKDENRDSFLEELIIRRELSMNFVHYNPNYDKFECLPDWAIKTLEDHKNDPRPYKYTLEQWEKAKTHDPFWNAAQKQAITTGKIAGYMRMYWGKKVIEWSSTPQEAYKTLVYLNDKYHLDGRDPNGYAGVAWCFGKHDRPWTGRAIFGTVRFMIDTGLKRKFDTSKYVMLTNKLK